MSAPRSNSTALRGATSAALRYLNPPMFPYMSVTAMPARRRITRDGSPERESHEGRLQFFERQRYPVGYIPRIGDQVGTADHPHLKLAVE